MITTQRKRVPWSWVALITLPIFSEDILQWGAGSQVIPLTLSKFTRDPALITFLSSLNFLCDILIVPAVAWYSDRIWTPFGRRKPFIVVGWLILVMVGFLIPIVNTLLIVALLIVVFQVFIDFSITGPYNTLVQEVVPPEQRGRWGAIRAFFAKVGMLFFAKFMLSRYEEPSIPVPLGFMGIEQININGEQFIYWTTCLLMLVMMIHIMFNVREKKPMEIPHFQHFDPLRYFKNVLGIIVESSARQPRKGEVRIRPHIFMQKQWLLLFSLIACQVCILQSIGPLEPLLITKQFGYSTRVLGNINFIWNLSMILVIPVAGFFADKVDRAKMFRLGIFISTFMPISYYMYVKVLAPDQIPAELAIILFKIGDKFVDVAASIALMPLIWDYIPRDKMALIFSGTMVVRGITKMIEENLVGNWVKYYSKFFLPEGEIDYMSGYIIVFIFCLFACGIITFFLYQRKKGVLVEYGKMGLENNNPGSSGKEME